jgi:hypothetical protein
MTDKDNFWKRKQWKKFEDGTPVQHYVRPVPRKVPDGVALVHNFMPTVLQEINPGLDGYRIFYVPLPLRGTWKKMKPCKCGAYPNLPVHYCSSGRKISKAVRMADSFEARGLDFGGK